MESFIHLAIIWCGVYMAVYAAKKTRLTPVLYYLAIGSLLVNTGILPHEPTEFIRGFAEFGIILIMFALGFEESTSNFVKSIKRSWGIAFFAGVAPFAYTYGVTYYFWNDVNIALMCGLAMTSTAIALTLVTLKSENLHRSKAAKGIITSAILEDISSLVLVAMLIPITTGSTEITLAGISFIVIKASAFFLLIALAGLWLFPHNPPGHLKKLPILRHIGARQLFSFGDGEHTVLGVFLMAVLGGLLAYQFGFHPAIGAYMAGLIIKEEYFHFSSKADNHYFENTRQIVDNVAFTWIGPVFFVVLGTHIIFDWNIVVSVIPHIIILTAGLFIVQISSAAIAAYYTGGFNVRESMMIGFGMLGRAELCFVVLDIAYVQYGILSTEAFFTLMGTAFWLNVAVPLTIAYWRPYFKEEKPLPWVKAA